MIVTLGRTSSRRLSTCCPPWRKIIEAAAADPDCPCDFGVVCGYRGEGGQTAAFLSNRSNAQWGQSDHNVRIGDTPYSMAVDIAPYSTEIRNYLWDDTEKFSALAAHILKTAARLCYSVEWGGSYKLKNGKNDPGHFSLAFR